MRLLFFIHGLSGGGAERVLVNLCNELVTRGYEVSITMPEFMNVYTLDSRVNVSTFIGLHKTDSKNVIGKFINFLKNTVVINRNVRLIIRENKPDIIITFLGFFTSYILLHHNKIPIIASEHYSFNRKLQFYRVFRIRYLNKLFDYVTFLTKTDVYLAQRYYTHSVSIPNPLSFDPISNEKYEELFPKRANILAVGRLDAYKVKGFDNLIVAFSSIAKKHPDVFLDIAGEGSEQSINILKEISESHGVGNKVRFLGYCNNIDELMKDHSIFVMSSRHEGFGMALVEAMALGCACVSFDLIGPGEIIIDGIDGVMVENQNIEDLAMKIELLLDNSQLRYFLGLHAIEDIKRFNPNAITNKWEMVFNKVLEQRTK